MKNKEFVVHNGYVEAVDVQSYTYDFAYDFLISEQKKYVTSILLNNEMVDIERKAWTCPHCHSENIIEGDFNMPSDALYDKLFSQFNMLSKRLPFYKCYEPSDNNDLRTCAKCNKVFPKSTRHSNVEVSYNDNTIIISKLVDDLSGLMDVEWISGDIADAMLALPLYERIIFDFSNAEIKMDLVDKNGVAYFTYDGVIKESLLDYDLAIRDEVYSMLCDIWQPNAFPYKQSELTTSVMHILVQFVGFPSRDFYLALPINIDNNRLNAGFKDISKDLHYYRDIEGVLKNSRLPNMKSIKRVMFENIQLFIYIRELEMLWDALKDNNCFLNIVNSDRCYEVLAHINQYPKLIDFMRDYAMRLSPASLVRRLLKNSSGVLSYAINYIALRDEAKEIEQSTWGTNDDVIEQYEEARRFEQGYGAGINTIHFSMPMHDLSCDYECEIDGYCFVILRNKLDYQRASRELGNCLCSWKSYDRPVVVVMRKNEMVAAIEIDVNKKKAIQAYAAYNTQIEDDADLERVVNKYYDIKSLVTHVWPFED